MVCVAFLWSLWPFYGLQWQKYWFYWNYIGILAVIDQNYFVLVHFWIKSFKTLLQRAKIQYAWIQQTCPSFYIFFNNRFVLLPSNFQLDDLTAKMTTKLPAIDKLHMLRKPSRTLLKGRGKKWGRGMRKLGGGRESGKWFCWDLMSALIVQENKHDIE